MRKLAAVLVLSLLALWPGHAGALSEVTPLIASSADPCRELDWHAERGLIERDDVEVLLRALDCRPAQYARTAVELAHGRASCEDIAWAARAEVITAAQWHGLLERYPQCIPRPVTLIDQAYAAAAQGDYRTVVALAAQAHGISQGGFLAVAACESGFNPNAYNRSGASGLLQILSGYWPARAANAGFPGASPFDPVANAWTGAWLWATSGSGHWAQCL